MSNRGDEILRFAQDDRIFRARTPGHPEAAGQRTFLLP
jgi:hypothetical protein